MRTYYHSQPQSCEVLAKYQKNNQQNETENPEIGPQKQSELINKGAKTEDYHLLVDGAENIRHSHAKNLDKDLHMS